MRSLREYRRVARQEHWCDRCCTYIQPGEEYQGTVYACGKMAGKKRLLVVKEHVQPTCEPPPDPDEGEKKHERHETHHLAAAA